jgi:hypothetical protein
MTENTRIKAYKSSIKKNDITIYALTQTINSIENKNI